jgi:hypothetical protein
MNKGPIIQPASWHPRDMCPSSYLLPTHVLISFVWKQRRSILYVRTVQWNSLWTCELFQLCWKECLMRSNSLCNSSVATPWSILCYKTILNSRSNSIVTYVPWKIQGYSKRSIYFQKFILQVLLNIWQCSIYRLNGELSKLFSHLTSTRCEPHVWCGRCL